MKKSILIALAIGLVVGCAKNESEKTRVVYLPAPEQTPPKDPGSNPSGQPSPLNPVGNPVDDIETSTDRLRLLNRDIELAFFEKFETAEPLNDNDLALANQIGQEMQGCGAKTSVPQCQDGEIIWSQVADSAKFIKVGDKIKMDYLHYTEIKSALAGSPTLAVVSKLKEGTYEYHLEQVQIFKLLKPRSGKTIVDYLNVPTEAQPLLQLTPFKTKYDGLYKIVENPTDVRQFYFGLKTYLEKNMINPDDRIAVKGQFVADTKDIRYQERVVALIAASKVLYSQDAKAFYGKLLDVESKFVKQIAAVNYHPEAGSNDERKNLRPLVMDALNHSMWQVRKDALVIIGRSARYTQLPEEQNVVLGKLSDEDPDVRKFAASLVTELKVNAENLETIVTLTRDPSWETRVQAVKVLTRINSPESLKVLIGMLADADTDVRKQAVKHLVTVTLKKESVSDLAVHMKNQNWEIRRDTVGLLVKINEGDAGRVLLENMDDADNDVRAKIMARVSKAAYSEEYQDIMISKFESPNWEVRRDVVLLIAKLMQWGKGLKAKKLIITKMDDSDPDVRDAINTALDYASVDSNVFDDVIEKLASPNWEVRRLAVRMLGRSDKEKKEAAKDALEKHRETEKDPDVIKSIEAALESLRYVQ